MTVALKEASRTNKRRPSTTSAVAKTMLDKASLTLAELPEKTKEVLSIQETVKYLLEPITAAFAKGYSQDDIASILSEQGIEITATSLKYYLAKVQPKTSSPKGKARQSRRTSTKSSAGSSKKSVDSAPIALPSADIPKAAAPTEVVPAGKGRRATQRKTAQVEVNANPTVKDSGVFDDSTTSSDAGAKTKRSPQAKTTKTAKAPTKVQSTRSRTPQSKAKKPATRRTSK